MSGALPSSPCSFRPKHATPPDSRSAHSTESPLEICFAPLTFVFTNDAFLLPPHIPPPQQTTSSPTSAHACASATLRSRASFSGGLLLLARRSVSSPQHLTAPTFMTAQ